MNDNPPTDDLIEALEALLDDLYAERVLSIDYTKEADVALAGVTGHRPCITGHRYHGEAILSEPKTIAFDIRTGSCIR